MMNASKFSNVVYAALCVTTLLLVQGCEKPKEVKGIMVPGEAFIDGRDPGGKYTEMVVDVSCGAALDSQRCCRLRHNVKVEVVKTQEISDKDLVRFQIRSPACQGEGWLSHTQLAKEENAPVGKVIEGPRD